MSEFAKLKDLCLKIGSGATPRGGNNVYLDKGNYTLIRSQNVYNEGFSEHGIVYISDSDAKKLDNVSVEENDVLINITGDSVARVTLPDNRYLPARVNQHVAILRANPEKLDFQFLKYSLIEKSMQEYLLTLASSGATRNALTKGMLENIEIKLPSLDEQKRVSGLLSKFDQKIQLNTQINKTLEQIAQALFKSWFVDFDPVRAKVQALSDGLSLEQAELAAMQTISGKTPEELTALSQTQPDRYAELAETAKAFPCEMEEIDGVEVPKGWELKPLGDLISFVKGKKPKSVSPKQEENMLPHILTSSLEGKYNEFCESNKLVTIEYHNTIMLMDGSNSGRIAIGHNGVIGSTLAKINLDNNKLWAVIYQFLKHKEADIQANTTGTTIPHTDKNRVNNYLMVIPDNFLLEKFTELFDNSLLKIISNRNQIISLETIRDLLLPRLLNGEIQL